MQRRKIVARIILLIISVINFALAAPVLERGILDVRVDQGDVAKDQDLRLHDPRSPMVPGAPGSTPPVDVPTSQPEHDGLQFGMDLNDHIPPQPGQEVTDGPDPGAHSTGSLTHTSSYPPTGYPQPSQEETGGPGPGPHSTDSLTHSGPYHSAEEASGLPMSPSSSDSSRTRTDPSLHDNMPYDPYLHGNGPVDILPHHSNPFGLSSPATMSEPGVEWLYVPEGDARRPASYPGYSRPSILNPPPEPPSYPGSPGSLDSEGSLGSEDFQNFLNELLRGGRLKRRISRSRSVNAAQKELQDSSYSTVKGSDKILDAPAATAMP
jgi:hypothetical protein